MTCHHAASGCNYPEGECLGLCMHEQQSAAPQSAVSPYERPCQFGLEAEQPSAEPVEFLLNGARLKLSFQQVQCEDCGTMSDELRAVPLDQYADELQGRWVALVPAEDDRHLRTDAAAGFPHHIHNAAGAMVAETCSEELAVYLVERANAPAETQALRINADYWQGRAATAERQRDDLLEALKSACDWYGGTRFDHLIAEVEKEQSRDAHR